MFHTKINGTIVVFSKNVTFKAQIYFCGSVPSKAANWNRMAMSVNSVGNLNLWVCNSHLELTVRYSWDCLMTHHAVEAASSLSVLQTHRNLTAISLWAHLVFKLWARSMASKWAHPDPWWVSFLWLSCELSVSYLWAQIFHCILCCKTVNDPYQN